MSSGNSLTNWIANQHIGTKIGAGFAAVMLIFAFSSVAAWQAFDQTSNAVDHYAFLVANSATFRDIDLTVARYRGYAREYVFSNDEATADLAVKDADALRKLIATGLARVVSPDRRALLEDMVKREQSYTGDFNRTHAANIEQGKVMTELDTIGRQATDGFSALLESAGKSGNMDLAAIAAEGRRLSLMARLDADKRLNAHDDAAGKSVEQGLSDLRLVLARLDTATKGGNLNGAVSTQAALVEQWQTAFRRAAVLDTQQLSVLNGSMREAGDALTVDAAKAKDSNLADQGTTERQALAATAGGLSRVTIFGLAGLVIGIALAWLIARGISRPVRAMCGAMQALAGGDKSVTIPAVGRKDEIGEMAGTVQVFKDNMIEAERLREANERQKADAEAERKRGMLRLADNFEAGIKGVVNSVASQATEMQSSAQAMTHTAETATQQATAVAASVEQATANVQTVASSAEELSASVREIGQQVEHSSKIAGQAVVEADRTNATVEGLAKTAQRIGDVVQLIETIAGQTNLLALSCQLSLNVNGISISLPGNTRRIPMILGGCSGTMKDMVGQDLILR